MPVAHRRDERGRVCACVEERGTEIKRARDGALSVVRQSRGSEPRVVWKAQVASVVEMPTEAFRDGNATLGEREHEEAAGRLIGGAVSRTVARVRLCTHCGSLHTSHICGKGFALLGRQVSFRQEAERRRGGDGRDGGEKKKKPDRQGAEEGERHHEGAG